MSTSAWISVSGLVLDIAGVALVFYFPILSNISMNLILYAEPTPEQIKDEKRVKFWAKTGFVLIIVGFLLQATGTIIGGLR